MQILKLLMIGLFAAASISASPLTKNSLDRIVVLKDLQSSRLYQDGDISCRVSPCSTFKIALSLMGYDAGILQSETLPQWPYEKRMHAPLDIWKTSHTPKDWIQHSCIWYSRKIVNQLGAERFKHYIDAFQYGNLDISGDAGKNNGLTHCWLSSSLTISPKEQIEFLEKFYKQQLPCSPLSYEMTKKIFFVEVLPSGWKLFGKSGTGFMKGGSQIGWFVGWAEKGAQTDLIALLIQDASDQGGVVPSVPAGWRAKDEVKRILNSL
jgi:beta-lactamase class D OXA-29